MGIGVGKVNELKWPTKAMHPQKVKDALDRFKRASMARKSAYNELCKLIYSPLHPTYAHYKLSSGEGEILERGRAKWLIKHGLAEEIAYCLSGSDCYLPCSRREADIIFREIEATRFTGRGLL